jgi:hypothetical protein
MFGIELCASVFKLQLKYRGENYHDAIDRCRNFFSLLSLTCTTNAIEGPFADTVAIHSRAAVRAGQTVAG